MNEYTFEDLSAGTKEEFSVKIDSSKIEKFIDICGDINPLHIDSSYAQQKGFDQSVVHGLLVSSFYSTLVGIYLPGKYCLLQGIKIEYTKPVYLNDTLTISGTVSYINTAYKQVEIKASIVNQDNKKVSKALIKIGLLDG